MNEIPCSRTAFLLSAGLASALLAASLATRVPGISRSLWSDELCAVHQAEGSFADPIRHQLHRGGHPPLYYVLLNIWLRAGTSDAWIRTLSVVLGCCLVIVVGFIGKELGGTQAGWTAAFFAAVIDPLCWPSCEARNYVLHLLCGALAWLFLARAIRSAQKSDWSLFAVCLAATWYSFYYGFYVAVALGVFFLLMRPTFHQLCAFTLAAAAAVVLFLPWLLRFVHQVAEVQRWALRANPPSWTAFGLLRLSGRSMTLHGPWNPLGAGTATIFGVPFAESLFLVVVTLTILYLTRRWPFTHVDAEHSRIRTAAIATMAAGIAFTLSSQITALVGAYARLRYATFLGVLWCVLAALVLQAAHPRLRLLAATVLIVVGLCTGYRRAAERPTDDWRGATTFVDANRFGGDCVITNAPSISRPYLHYTTSLRPAVVYETDGRDIQSILLKIRKEHSGMWIMWVPVWMPGSHDGSHSLSNPPPSIRQAIIAHGFRPTSEQTFSRGIVVASYHRRDTVPDGD